MERIALAITTPSLHRRVSEALSAPGWDVVSCDASGAAPLSDIRLLVAESATLAAHPGLVRAGLRVIVLVCGEDDPFWDSALGRRAAGIVDRDDPDQGFVTAVTQVLTGRGWISPELVPRVLARMPVPTRPRMPSAAVTERLTGRESDIARLVAEGLSNSEIAERLTIERSTVKFHVSNALRKLRCRDRAQLAVLLHSSGGVRAA